MTRSAPAHVITDDSALGGSIIERSLRYGRVANTYLARTNGSNGNRKTWTYSFWMKRTKTGNVNCLNRGNTSVAPWFFFYIENEKFWLWILTSGSSGSPIYWYNVVRDLNAWYHIVLRIDTTQSTAANRARLYINGVEATIQQDNRSTIPQDHDTEINGTSEIRIFNNEPVNQSLEGYLADVYLIDGSSLDPTSFGYTESQTGLWRPKKYTGTYGTNGFHLEFKDNSGTTATTLGKDTSGNGNNWTPNNFSVTAGYNNDSTLDTPTNNFNTFNRLDFNSNADPDAGGLLTNASATGGHYPAFTSIPVKSGKWYLEFDSEADGMLPSIMEIQHDSGSHNTDSTVGNNTSTVNKRGYGLLTGDGRTSHNGTYTSYGSRIHGAGGDVGMCAFDADNGKIYWGKNNTWFNSGNPVTGDNPAFSGIDMTKDWVFTFHVYGNSNNVKVKFGSNGFTYTPPAGFKALSSKNLSPNVPSIIRPQKHFDTLLYTGNGTSQRISGLEFAPDIVWIKARTGASNRNHNLFDTIRVFAGDGTKERIYPNLTNEGQSSIWSSKTNLTDFHHDGFSVGAGTDTNTNTYTYVAWCWKAGGAAVSNSDGTITSQVSANTEAGFSIVSYTGNGANNATVGHGLGKSPDWVIVKDRDTNSAGNNWYVFHSALASGHYVKLNQDSATAALSGTSNGGVGSVTSTTFNFVQGTSGNNKNVNESGDNFIAYCWTEIPGYSKFGSYSGNSSTDGTYVHLGFRPAWVMVKRYDGSGQGWNIFDSKRNTFNLVDEFLIANSSNAEATGSALNLDFLSNGIKFRGSDGGSNTSGSDYIYMVFAEQPGTTSFETFPNSR